MQGEMFWTLQIKDGKTLVRLDIKSSDTKLPVLDITFIPAVLFDAIRKIQQDYISMVNIQPKRDED